MTDLRLGDCLEVMRGMPDCSVDAVVTDPPYHLTTGKKGGSGPASVNPNSPAGRSMIGTGFMGMTWDGGDIAQDPVMWVEVLRLLKPGGWLLAFGGTRTQHRMVCAIEDAGFEIRDQIAWTYASGFPKSHNGPWGGTALKPAWEPICVARKPLAGTVEANWREHGTGALNIDGCRIAVDPRVDDGRLGGAGAWSTDKAAKNVYEGGYAGNDIKSSALGRWPANLIHDGSDEVVALFPQSTSGAMKSGTQRTAQDEPGSVCYGTFGGNITTTDIPASSGSAARFFYCAKASKQDRDEGLDHLPEIHRPNGNKWTDQDYRIANGERAASRESGPRRNHHPTVKPTDLMRYLCRLVTPKGGIVLDPFMGSGSTGRGAVLEGLRFIGIEREEAYMHIARARIDSARRQGHQPALIPEAV